MARYDDGTSPSIHHACARPENHGRRALPGRAPARGAHAGHGGGGPHRARLCAALLAEELPALCRNGEAVRATLAVLLLAGGFEQAGRLVRMLSGTTLRLLPDAPGIRPEPAIREHEGVLTVLLDAARLDGGDRAAVAERWSGAILRALPD